MRSERRRGKRNDLARPFFVPHRVSGNGTLAQCTWTCCPRRTTSAMARHRPTFAASGTGVWVLPSEHWAAPAPGYLELLTTDAHTTRLEVVCELQERSTHRVVAGRERGIEDRVLGLLVQGATVTRAKLRDSLGVKNERLGEVLEALERAGRLCRTPAGWQRRNGSLEGGRSRSL